LDANLAEAHADMGRIKNHHDWDWAGADASFQRALTLAPGDASVVLAAADTAATLGRFDEALTLVRRAVRLDPVSARSYYGLGVMAYWAGRWEEAITALRKALELNPEYQDAHGMLGRVFLAQGHLQRALAEMEREPDPSWRLYALALVGHALGREKESELALEELVKKSYEQGNVFQIAEVYAFRGEADQAFEWLERAYTQRDGGLSQIKGDPLLKNLEGDPRYGAFLKKMRLPD
jgi:tetratricopeptide (TPR) repeat protein